MNWNRRKCASAMIQVLGIFIVLAGSARLAAQSDTQAAKFLDAMQRDDLASVQAEVSANRKLLTQPLIGTGKVPLCYAIQQQKLGVAQWLLQQDAPLGKINGRDLTPIQYALQGRNSELIDLILTHRPDINQPGDNGDTPLMTAIKYRHHGLDTIKKLLKKGASVTSANRSRQTPLHLACYYNRGDVIEELINAGAKLDSVDSGGNTPFHAACMSAPKMVAMFMKKGADPNQLNRQKQNALHLLCRSSVESSVNLIIDQMNDLNQPDANGDTPLSLAAIRKKPSIVKMLIDKGADPNRATRRRYGGNATPLILASRAGQPDMVATLLKAKAKPNVIGQNGNAPLHETVVAASNYLINVMDQRNPAIDQRMKNFSSVVQLLLEHGAEANMLNHEGKTPVRLAAEGSFFAAVELLVSQSNDLTFNVGNSSLLHWSARHGLTKTAKRLFVGDININQPDSDGQTALMLSTKNGHATMVEFLLNKGADAQKADANGMTPLMHAANLGSTEIAKALLDANVEVDRQDPGGQSAVHFAAWSGAAKIINLLAVHQADVNAVTPSGYTPLMASAWNGHIEACRALQENGAKVNQVDSDGWSALHKAAYRGHTAVVRLLLKHGAKQAANSAGMTPRSLAPKSNQTLLNLLDQPTK